MQGVPEKLKPYVAHGVELEAKTGEQNALGSCPFCGREGKFSVHIETGRWRCFVCNVGEETDKSYRGGNSFTFIRLLWVQSSEQWDEKEAARLARERGLLDPDTLYSWGARQSALTGRWIVPGYTADGKITQLYRYVKTPKGMRLLATAGLPHGLHGVPLVTESDEVYLCEGPWDAMALWEVFQKSGDSDLSRPTVLAAPGSSVFSESWLPLFAEKQVAIVYDSDHPRLHCRACKRSYSSVEHTDCPECRGALTGPEVSPAGWEGSKRVAVTVSSGATSVKILRWGKEGYDPKRKSGYDLRDHLTQSGEATDRRDLFQGLLQAMEPVKVDGQEVPPQRGGLRSLPCTSWRELTQSWRKAMKWTEGLDRALSVMLASVTSTKSVGDQLWVKIISPPSGGKSTLCEALGVSQHVVSLSTIRGFHSGFKSDAQGKEDNSLIVKIQDKTLVVKDGDTLLQAPNLGQILAEARDLYDKTSRSHYRNRMGKDYHGVNMTWILCGTSSLRQLDSSELGERFLDCVIMDKIDPELEHDILWRVVRRADREVSSQSNGQAVEQYTPQQAEAMRKTGGYVDYLRQNAQPLLSKVTTPQEALHRCVRLGQLVAYLRARPSKHQDESAERELASRLVSQHMRLAKCLAVVLNRKEVDEEVLKRTSLVALDTARGKSMEIAKNLYGSQGLTTQSLVILTGSTDAKCLEYLRFLRNIGAVENFTRQITTGLKSKPLWRLTEPLQNLYREVVLGEPDPEAVDVEEEQGVEE